MFRAIYHSSSGALTVFAASGLHTQVWVGTEFPLRLDYGRSPHAYVNQRLQIHLGLLMMSGVTLETFWVFNGRWNNKFCYKVASCWLFLLNLKRKCSGNWIKSCYSVIFYFIIFQITDCLDNIHWLGSTVSRGIMAMLWYGLSLCVTCCWQNKVHILNTFSVGSRYFFDGVLSLPQCFPGT
jgi:hypothetical protein